MSTIQEIESAIKTLPDGDVLALSQWLQEFAQEKWDKRMAADAAAGRFVTLVNEAKQAGGSGPDRRVFP